MEILLNLYNYAVASSCSSSAIKYSIFNTHCNIIILFNYTQHLLGLLNY